MNMSEVLIALFLFKKKILCKELVNKKPKIAATPAHKKDPVSSTSPDRIHLTLQNQRGENKGLLKEIAGLRDKIAQSAIPVNKDLHDVLGSIHQKYLRDVNEKRNVSQFLKLFIAN